MRVVARVCGLALLVVGAAWVARAQTAAAGTGLSTTAPAAPTPAATTPAAPAKCAPDQDWANLHRYRADNAGLAPVPAGEHRVVFMGDSITDGWGRWEGRGPFFPGKPYVNRGISGQTTPQMLVRFQQDVVHLQPAAVVILAGANDIAGNTGPSTPEMIEDNLQSMAAIAKANGIKVVMASITPAYDFPWKPGLQPVAEIQEINAWIKAFCAREGAVYLDYYSSLADAKGAMLPGYSFDGVHPTAKGYAVMGPLAEAAIAQASGQ